MTLQFTLMTMPPEVIIEIYILLSTFRDVFALAATCRRLDAIWCENATPIYHSLAPSEIGFLKLARQLLADQGGAPTTSTTMTAHDVRRMVRNARKAHTAADVFFQETLFIVPSLASHPLAYQPPSLTRTEYPRFLRAYYRTSSLLELDPSLCKERYMSYTLRQLYRTYEMFKLARPLGDEIWPKQPSYSTPEGRDLLCVELGKFLCKKRMHIHGQDVSPLKWASHDIMQREFGDTDLFVTIRDSHRKEFHRQVVGSFRPGNTPKPYDEYMKEVVWGDSSDEETYR